MESTSGTKIKRSRHRPLKIVLIVFTSVFVLLAGTLLWAYLSLTGAVGDIQMLDDDGHLYMVEYRGDLQSPVFKAFPALVSNVGCSAFTAKDGEGNTLTGRNYDYVHFDKDGNFSYVDVLLRLDPEGKYASINSCDFEMFNKIGCNFQPGCLDDPDGICRMALGFAPYACEDGMNETGLSAAILQLDTKDGESHTRQTAAGKSTVTATMLLREILDNCKSVEEAKQLADIYNMVSCLGADFHIYVADAEGNSTVLEWRYNELNCVDTDACTNFYVGSDDACDSYKRGKLYEAYTPVNGLYKTYHMGYGHGYKRFAEIVSSLDEKRDQAGEPAELSAQEAMELLSRVSQNYDPDSQTSGTLWSLVFHNSQKTIDICLLRNFDTVYTVGFDNVQ